MGIGDTIWSSRVPKVPVGAKEVQHWLHWWGEMDWGTYLSDGDEKFRFLDVGGTLVIAGKEMGRDARRWGVSEIGREYEKVLYFNAERNWATNRNVFITDRDDLVEHGQDIILCRVDIRRVGCGAHKVEVVLNTVVNIEFAFH